MITELYTYPNIAFIEIITEMSTNSRSVAGLGDMQKVVVKIFQQNLRGELRANIT